MKNRSTTLLITVFYLLFYIITTKRLYEKNQDLTEEVMILEIEMVKKDSIIYHMEVKNKQRPVVEKSPIKKEIKIQPKKKVVNKPVTIEVPKPIVIDTARTI
jgi:hypothetical protein